MDAFRETVGLHSKIVVLNDLLHHLDGGQVSENVSAGQPLWSELRR